MSLQMDKKIDAQLLDSVLNFLKLLAEADAGSMASQEKPAPIVLDAFRLAFQSAGLDGVDALLESLNEEIKLSGGTVGFGEGAALQHADGEYPAFLHIYFADFNTGKVLARESISLRQSVIAPAPE